MAIKISNTIVLDDSRDIANGNSATFTGNGFVKVSSGNTAQRPVTATNGMLRYNTDEQTFEGYVDGNWNSISTQIVLTPTNVDPANGETAIAVTNPTLEGSPYYHLYGKVKANGQWQIANTSNFNTTVVDQVVSGNAVTYTTSVTLPEGVKHYWRVRYQDSDGVWSNYSTATEFTTILNPPTTLGQSYQGGYYTGVINIGGGVCYYLIVAPNATGCASCQWKTTSTTTSGTGSDVNGYTNTYGPMDNADHPAGNWTATRTIGGYSDWYLPAYDELDIMYTNRNSMPSGEEYSTNIYWSSTEYVFGSFPYGRSRWFLNGFPLDGVKPNCQDFRAVRRVPI